MGPRRVLAVVQARTSSSRLPGKVLRPVLGLPMILRQLERIRRAERVDGIVLATSDDPSDDDLARTVTEAGYAVHRGSLDDVLRRLCGALDRHPAEHVVRLTGDCPLTDPALIDATVARHLATGADYTSNCLNPSFPDGLDVEVVLAETLRMAAREAGLTSEREHVTPFIWKQPGRFRLAELRSPVDRSGFRWTVDTEADLRFVTAVYEALHAADPGFATEAILALLEARPEIAALNAGGIRNEGYAASLAAETASESDNLAPVSGGSAIYPRPRGEG